MKLPVTLILILAAVCLGCRAVKPKPSPAVPILLAPAKEQVVLTWTYPLTVPRTAIIFEIQQKLDLRNATWTKIGETLAPPFVAAASNKASFYRIVTRATGKVQLEWDPSSPSTGVVGYDLVYGGHPGMYTNVIKTVSTITTATASNIVNRTWFAAVARDVIGITSQYSNEVDYSPEAPQPVSNLTITKL